MKRRQLGNLISQDKGSKNIKESKSYKLRLTLRKQEKFQFYFNYLILFNDPFSKLQSQKYPYFRLHSYHTILYHKQLVQTLISKLLQEKCIFFNFASVHKYNIGLRKQWIIQKIEFSIRNAGNLLQYNQDLIFKQKRFIFQESIKKIIAPYNYILMQQNQDYFFFFHPQMLFDQQYAYYAHNQGVLNPFCYQFQQIPSEHKISEFEEKIPEPQVEQKCRKKYNKKKVDPDFKTSEIRKKKQHSFQQKEGRNTASNILRTFSKFLCSGKFDTLFERVRWTNKLNISKLEFLKWVQDIGINYKNYVKVNWVIKRLQHESEQVKMFLILLRIHFDAQAKAHLLTSSKIKSQNKVLTLQRIRSLWKQILQGLDEGKSQGQIEK